MSQRGNMKRNLKVFWAKWKQDLLKFVGCSKAVLKVKFIGLNAYIREERSKAII